MASVSPLTLASSCLVLFTNGECSFTITEGELDALAPACGSLPEHMSCWYLRFCLLNQSRMFRAVHTFFRHDLQMVVSISVWPISRSNSSRSLSRITNPSCMLNTETRSVCFLCSRHILQHS
uniref:Putative secreted protein n=1 Tax=Anopheles darlingi TaxID=43151 RepID=A0A2M4DGP0_ANODA